MNQHTLFLLLIIATVLMGIISIKALFDKSLKNKGRNLLITVCVLVVIFIIGAIGFKFLVAMESY